MRAALGHAVAHAAEADPRDLEAGLAEIDVFHDDLQFQAKRINKTSDPTAMARPGTTTTMTLNAIVTTTAIDLFSMRNSHARGTERKRQTLALDLS